VLGLKVWKSFVDGLAKDESLQGEHRDFPNVILSVYICKDRIKMFMTWMMDTIMVRENLLGGMLTQS